MCLIDLIDWTPEQQEAVDLVARLRLAYAIKNHPSTLSAAGGAHSPIPLALPAPDGNSFDKEPKP